MARASTGPGTPAPSDIDPFFHFVPGGRFNACIGRQGSPENYIDGYMEAAQELVSAVIDKRQFGKRDTLAMPILYNARHALELACKFAIEKLIKLGRPITKIKPNHDIMAHWTALNAGPVGDEIVRRTVKQLKPFVESLAAIDEDGQELRYATNRAGARSLEPYSLVDLDLVQESLERLAQLVSDLKHRVIELFEEKASGTWTPACSRSDLLEIAKLLPPRDHWKTEDFTEAKRVAMERFCLGSRKFAEAVKKIEASREGRALLGLETPLKHLTDEHLLLAIETWRKQHPQKQNQHEREFLAYSTEHLRERMLDRHQRSGVINEGLELLLSELAPDEVADLEAIFYIGREGWMPEFYDETLERTKLEHAVAPDLKTKLLHILEKLNFCDGLQTGLRILGKTELADKVGAFKSGDQEV